MEYEVEGSRPRGKPKRTWREAVQKDCQARDLNRGDAMVHGRIELKVIWKYSITWTTQMVKKNYIIKFKKKTAHIFKVVRDIATKIVKVRQTANTFIVIGDTSADMKLKWRAMVPDYWKPIHPASLNTLQVFHGPCQPSPAHPTFQPQPNQSPQNVAAAVPCVSLIPFGHLWWTARSVKIRNK